jgi:crotonobetainyl-CoA:carnitine CoA-transferase CaiB-like acyl-CoA transferase
MAQEAVQGEAPPPMSVRRSAWSVYDIFYSSDNERVFVGVVSDTLWKAFCTEFGLTEFLNDPSLDNNNDRVKARERILPIITTLLASMDKVTLMARLDRAGVPFAPINTPSDLFTDPHLNAGGLIEVTLPDGKKTQLPALPIELNGARPGLRHDLPREGAHSKQTLQNLGYSDELIEQLLKDGIINPG